MDKSDIAILISLVSATASLASAAYTRQLVRNDNARMKRTPPSLEVTHVLKSTDYEDLFSVSFVVRNVENYAIRLKGVRVRTLKRAKIAWPMHETALGDRREWDAPQPLQRDKYELKNNIPMRDRLAPSGCVDQSKTRHNDEIYFNFLSEAEMSSADLILEWEWADGHRL